MLFIVFFPLIILSVLIFYSRKLYDPYKLYFVFGKKGSGKTTLMCKLSFKYSKAGSQWHVFSNIDLPGSVKIDPSSLGRISFPERSVILLDEAGLIWDARDYSKFPEYVKVYFKYQRQYKHRVYLFSQTNDVDKKIRDLTDNLYLCTCPIPCISVVRKIKRFVTLVQPDTESEGRIADGLEFIPFWYIFFGVDAFSLIWIPHWIKYFKSFNPPSLPVGVFRSMTERPFDLYDGFPFVFFFFEKYLLLFFKTKFWHYVRLYSYFLHYKIYILIRKAGF